MTYVICIAVDGTKGHENNGQETSRRTGSPTQRRLQRRLPSDLRLVNHAAKLFWNKGEGHKSPDPRIQLSCSCKLVLKSHGSFLKFLF